MVDFPRFPALISRDALWLRQFGDTSERTLPNIINTMQTFHYDCLALKVADGLTYQGFNDLDKNRVPITPITSLADIEAMRNTLAAADIAFLPVMVPRGLAGEAEMHGAIAKLNGCGLFDIEPYTGFFDQASTSLIPVYADYLRRAAGNAYLINEPDPRVAGYTDGRVAESAQFFDGIAAQHYVGWSSIGWTNVASEVQTFQTKIQPLGLDCYATLYGVDRIDLAQQFWRTILPSALGFCCFAMGAMDAQQLRSFALLSPGTKLPFPIPGTTVPTPPPPVDPQPLAGDWQLRLGLAAQLERGIQALLDSGQKDAAALQAAQQVSQTVLDTLAKV